MSKKEKWQEMMDFLAVNHEKYDDVQFAERFSLACDEIPPETEVTHEACNKIITSRVIAYCEQKKIRIEDYDGPMPYRSHSLNTGPEKLKHESSTIVSTEYDFIKQDLTVEFKGNSFYTYHKMPLSVYEKFKASESKGSFLAKEVKGTFDFTKLEEIKE